MVPPISTSLSGRTFEPRALQDLGDELRRAFARPNGEHLVAMHQERFLDGARNKGVPGEAARKIFPKINGHYMFPESHPHAFAVTAYQAAWLKRHYPVEFFVSMMNNQPMGLYPVETLKQDARRFGVPFLNPCVNRSGVRASPTTTSSCWVSSSSRTLVESRPSSSWGSGSGMAPTPAQGTWRGGRA